MLPPELSASSCLSLPESPLLCFLSPDSPASWGTACPLTDWGQSGSGLVCVCGGGGGGRGDGGGGASECVVTNVMPQNAPPHVIAQSGCVTEELLQMKRVRHSIPVHWTVKLSQYTHCVLLSDQWRTISSGVSLTHTARLDIPSCVQTTQHQHTNRH